MPRPKGNRIVMLAYTHYPWDPRVRREAETLARSGKTVAVVCARDRGQSAEETFAGVHVRRLPLTIRRGGRLRYVFQYGMFILLAAAAVREQRRWGRLVAVHVHSLPDFLVFAAFGARLRGIPVVLDLHESLPEIFRARFPGVGVGLAVASEKLSCLISDRVIVTSETILESLIARGIPAGRILILYNSPDLAAQSDRVVELPLRGEGLRIVYVGGVDEERDVATLVRAIAEIRKLQPAVLAVYGHGPDEYRRVLEDLVERLGIRDSVYLGGQAPRETVLALLSQSDVGVATYERNPLTEVILPSKAFEYLALDKPIVLPNLKAMRRTFDGIAWFYEPGNPGDLAAKILESTETGPDAASRLARARALYAATNWQAQSARLGAMYADLEARPRRTGT